MAASTARDVIVVKNKKKVATGRFDDEKKQLVLSGQLESTINEQQVELQTETGKFVWNGKAVYAGAAATYQIT